MLQTAAARLVHLPVLCLAGSKAGSKARSTEPGAILNSTRLSGTDRTSTPLSARTRRKDVPLPGAVKGNKSEDGPARLHRLTGGHYPAEPCSWNVLVKIITTTEPYSVYKYILCNMYTNL